VQLFQINSSNQEITINSFIFSINSYCIWKWDTYKNLNTSLFEESILGNTDEVQASLGISKQSKYKELFCFERNQFLKNGCYAVFVEGMCL
jgi:hypothetical protein